MIESLLKSFLTILVSATLVFSARAQDNVASPENCAGAATGVNRVPGSSVNRFETSASLLWLQPGSGNLVYATLINPLPALTPHWNNQAVSPALSPGFNVGLRYIQDSDWDIALAWTHLNTYDSATTVAGSSQAIGPSFLIGPPPPYASARAVAHFAYDAVTWDAGLFLNPRNQVQVRPFVGLEGARLSQRLSTNFLSSDGSISFTDASESLFTGAGPRLGVDVHSSAGNFDFVGGMAGALLAGTTDSRIDFITASPRASAFGLSPNSQFLTSPNSIRLIPAIDAKLGVRFNTRLGDLGLLKFEAGYQAAVYFNAVNQYSLTEVETAADAPFEGSTAVFLRTAVESQSNFWVHGPYLKLSFEF